MNDCDIRGIYSGSQLICESQQSNHYTVVFGHNLFMCGSLMLCFQHCIDEEFLLFVMRSLFALCFAYSLIDADVFICSIV